MQVALAHGDQLSVCGHRPSVGKRESLAFQALYGERITEQLEGDRIIDLPHARDGSLTDQSYGQYYPPLSLSTEDS